MKGSDRFADYKKLIDYNHLEHLSKTAEALFGMFSPRSAYWYDKYWVKLLKKDQIPSVILRALNYYNQR